MSRSRSREKKEDIVDGEEKRIWKKTIFRLFLFSLRIFFSCLLTSADACECIECVCLDHRFWRKERDARERCFFVEKTEKKHFPGVVTAATDAAAADGDDDDDDHARKKNS